MKIWNLFSKDNEDGFTMVEILVSLAILGIVTAMGMSIFSYNANSFSKGSAAMKEQSSLRLASYTLTDEFRNIGYIDLGNDSFASSDEIAALGLDDDHDADNFVFLSDSGIRKGSAAAFSDISDAEVEDIFFSLRKSGGKYFLGITLKGKTESYATEVLLNNIITDDEIQIGAGSFDSSEFASIQYNYNPPPFESAESPAAPPPSEEEEEEVLALLNTPNTTVPKGTTYTYTANAAGGTAPYSYEITVISSEGNAPSVSGNSITWNSPSGANKKMKFAATVTDSADDTVTTGTVTVTTN